VKKKRKHSSSIREFLGIGLFEVINHKKVKRMQEWPLWARKYRKIMTS